MRLDGVLLCEGIGQDARGAFTFIAVNQNVLVAESLPHVEKRICVILLSEERPNEESTTKLSGTASFKVRKPNGDIDFAITQPIPQVQKRWSDLATNLIFAADVLVQASEYGEYAVECEITPTDGEEPIIAHQRIYVVPVPTEPYTGAPHLALPR
jgi:hypothetical protein